MHTLQTIASGGSSHVLTPPLAHTSWDLAVLYTFTVPATKPVCGEVMFIRNLEISPTLLRDFLGHRLLMREQTSWGKLPVLELRQLIVSDCTLHTQGA